MQRRNIALLCVVAVVVVACAVAGYHMLQSSDEDGGSGGGSGASAYFPDPITDDMRERPSTEDMESAIDAAVSDFIDVAMTEGAGSEAMSEAALPLITVYGETQIKLVVLYWDYYRDPASYGEELIRWSAVLDGCTAAMDDAFREAAEGPNGEEVRRVATLYLGESYVDNMLSTGSTTQEQMDLQQRESELVAAYYEASDPDEIAGIYLELIDVRNRLAETYGYDSYADYSYEVTFGRDYSPEDLEETKEIVKEELVPLILEMLEEGFTIQYSYDGEDELFADASPFIHSVSEDFGDLYDYMIDQGLLDFEDVPTKVNLGVTYTATFFDTKVVYVFDRPDGTFNDLRTLVHEFGHAANAGLKPYYGTDHDIGEIQSQGLEALFALNPIGLEDQAEGISTFLVLNLMDSIIAGCLFDDFQLMAYEGGADSAEDLDAIYDRLVSDYGSYSHYEWYEVSHNFDYPFYYVSYAVSAFNALEIFVDGLEDYDAAVDEYLAVLGYYETGYNAMTESLGMMSIFDADDMSTMLAAMSDYFGAEARAGQSLLINTERASEWQ